MELAAHSLFREPRNAHDRIVPLPLESVVTVLFGMLYSGHEREMVSNSSVAIEGCSQYRRKVHDATRVNITAA
jgi:hypothetical protein